MPAVYSSAERQDREPPEKAGLVRKRGGHHGMPDRFNVLRGNRCRSGFNGIKPSLVIEEIVDYYKNEVVT